MDVKILNELLVTTIIVSVTDWKCSFANIRCSENVGRVTIKYAMFTFIPLMNYYKIPTFRHYRIIRIRNKKALDRTEIKILCYCL